MKNIQNILFMTVIALLSNSVSAKALPTGWTSIGGAGSSSVNDGVVTVPNGYTSYEWVSTSGGVIGNVLPDAITGGGSTGTGTSTNGSTAQSDIFSATAGDKLSFNFNYVTSDGAGYSDYAWAKLINTTTNDSALLFTARTTPSGNTVPGFNMPNLNALITPLSSPIIPGGPSWSALKESSSACWDVGCGYTGWINASYSISKSDNYRLELGVANWNDTIYQSGLAFAGATVASKSIEDDGLVSAIPEAEEWAMMLLALPMIGWVARYKKQIILK